MKKCFKRIAAIIIIFMIFFMNVTLNFKELLSNEKFNNHFINTGAQEVYASNTFDLPISEDGFMGPYVTTGMCGSYDNVLIMNERPCESSGFFKADLNNLPFTYQDISSVSLRTYCYEASEWDNIKIHRLNSYWTETYPDFTPDYCSTLEGSVFFPNAVKDFGWFNIDVTSSVIGFLRGTYENNGWIFCSTNGPSYFWAREYENPKLRPYLHFELKSNYPPSMNIITPTEYSINKSFIPSISVSDPNGDVLTCKYYLDSETAPRDIKHISNTATAQNVSFNMLDINSISTGAHIITYEISDGKADPVKQPIGFTIDRTPPGINPIQYTSSDTSITIYNTVDAGTTDLHDQPYMYTINGAQSGWTANQSYTASSLAPNTRYNIKFEARDKLGNTAGQHKDVYTKAQKPSASLTGSTETTLNLRINDNNLSNTQYQITTGSQYVDATGALTPTIQWITLPNKSISLSGLQPNSQYTVNVKARNANGEETESSQAIRTTLANPPVITFPEIKQNYIKLAWNAVAGAISYMVEADSVNKGTVTGTEYMDSNLTPETEHRYRIKVKNAGGEGNWGSYYNAVTLPYPPATPSNIEAVEKQTTITLTWDKVPKATGYEIETDGSAVPVNAGSALSYIHKGLMPETMHKYRVRAVNTGGAGEWSEYITKTTLPDPPPTPADIKILKTNTSITLAWLPTERATSYKVMVDGQIQDNKNKTSYVHEGLMPLSMHKYKIKAVNKGGESNWCEEISIITNPNKPNIPSNVIATADTSSVTLTWYKVPYAESYEVEMDGSIIKSTTDPNFTFSGLAADSKHTFKVKAVNVTGKSEWGKEVAISTFSNTESQEDTSLANIIAVVTNNNIALSWDDITHNGNYEIEVDGVLSDNGKSTAYNHTGLTAETYHTYRIREKGSEGAGKWCAVLTLLTMPNIPDAPKGLNALAANNSIEIRWDRVQGALGYDIEADGTIIDSSNLESYIQQPLESGTTHTYRVRAKNVSGVTAWSDAVSKSTINPTCTLQCKTGEKLSLSLTAAEVQDFTGFKLVVAYNGDELDVVDLCGFTPDKDNIAEGAIPGTKLSIKYTRGKIEFTVNDNIAPGTMWSGEITDIIFMPKLTGTTKLNYYIETN